MLSEGTINTLPQFDQANHVAEILAGIGRANLERGGSLEVEAMEIVPDDYAGKLQAQHVAYKIALAFLRD